MATFFCLQNTIIKLKFDGKIKKPTTETAARAFTKSKRVVLLTDNTKMNVICA